MTIANLFIVFSLPASRVTAQPCLHPASRLSSKSADRKNSALAQQCAAPA
jgi:hypothetical protein